MNKNIDLTEVLKNCPRGFKLYSPICGICEFGGFNTQSLRYPIHVNTPFGGYINFTKEGYLYHMYDLMECVLFPSKDQRDWSKFTAPWLKKEKFDPKTLQPFDRVVVKNIQNNIWHIQYFSHINEKSTTYPFFCLHDSYAYCIPYNDDTKHLVGTTDEAPEYYKYWED